MSARVLLARFAFSLLVVGIALAWTGRSSAQAGRDTRAALADGGAVICIVLGFVGVKLRHGGRSHDDEERRGPLD